MTRQAQAIRISVVFLLLSSVAWAEGSTDRRAALRRTVGDLEARAADTRAFVREHANKRGQELEDFRSELVEVRIAALQRDLDAVRAAAAALRDTELRSDAGGMQLAIDSCWPKWKRWFAADKYLFRASIRTPAGTELRGIAIREPSNGDIDIVRIPPSSERDDGELGSQFEIYDSFKIWGTEAELVVEDASGAEHVLVFQCD